MQVEPFQVVTYQTKAGRCPFLDWHSRLARESQAIVDARVHRVRLGLLGDAKSVGSGVFELRIHISPGLRVYFALMDSELVVLLAGGIKSTQAKDIVKAKQYLNDYKERV